MPNKLVIIPTFNERDNVEVLIKRLFQYVSDISILIVDDNSPDGTADRCYYLMEQFPELYVEKRSGKLGLGSAYRFGFEWGLNQGFKWLIEMDADMSHRVRDLVSMIAVADGDLKPDLVIGSRWVEGGSTINWPRRREALSRLANLYVRFMLGMGVNDSTAGFRIYSAGLLNKIALNQVRSEGYSFQIEMTRVAKQLGAKIVEVPIIFRERESGMSKMSISIVLEAMSLVTVWGINRFLHLK